MFTNEQYLLGWGCYATAAIILLLLVWFSVRGFWRYPKHFIILSAACVLLTPYNIDANSSYLAPAWLMASMETVFNLFKTGTFDADIFFRAGKPLLITWFSVIIAYFVCLVGVLLASRYLFNGSKTKTNTRSSGNNNADYGSSNSRVEPSLAAAAGSQFIGESSEQVWDEPTSPLNLIDESAELMDTFDKPLEAPKEPNAFVEPPPPQPDAIDDNTVIKPRNKPEPSSPLHSEQPLNSLPDDDYNDRLEASLHLQTGLEFDLDQELDKLTNPNYVSNKRTAIQQQGKRDSED